MALPQLLRRVLVGLVACLSVATSVFAADDFLDPEIAFRLSARAVDAKRIEVRFDIAPGYYLYRERLNADISPSSLKIAGLLIPPGKIKYDDTFQKDVEYHRDSVTMMVSLEEAASGPFRLNVGNQGCADKGLCYTPQRRAFDVEVGADGAIKLARAGEAATAGAGLQLTASGAAPVVTVAAPAAADEADGVSGVLKSGNPLFIVGLFMLLGLGLAFTPCVLPMLPILSSIIVGQKGAQAVSRRRGFSLALAYSLGMALVYTALGVASALAGEGLGAALQNAWVLGGFALLLALFSLSMFGVYEMQLPPSLQSKLTEASQRFKGGQHVGVFAMGGVSSLIVGPCVAAPLAGALVYISQTRDVVLGGTALFSLAVGMSVPLLLLGISAGTLLPKAGAWMEHVKHAFGVLLLATAVWLVSPVVSMETLMLLVAFVLVVAAAYLGALKPIPKPIKPLRALSRGLGVLALVFAFAQMIGSSSGGYSVLRPLAHLSDEGVKAGEQVELKFKAVSSLAQLDAAVLASTKPVMLDFYADWCVACKEFEKFTFTNPAVRQKMATMTLLRADVTANTEDDKALLRRYALFGPPAMLFFAPAGNELPKSRVIGFVGPREFGAHLGRVLP